MRSVHVEDGWGGERKRWKGREFVYILIKTLAFGSGSVQSGLSSSSRGIGGGWPGAETSGPSGTLILGDMKTNEVSEPCRSCAGLLRAVRVRVFVSHCLQTRVCTCIQTCHVLRAAWTTCIYNPPPSYVFDVAYRIGLAAALLRGCSAGMTARIYHKSLQISMLARTEQLAPAPEAPELLLCIEWRHYHRPDLALWHRLGLIIPCGRINSQRRSLGGGRSGEKKARRERRGEEGRGGRIGFSGGCCSRKHTDIFLMFP